MSKRARKERVSLYVYACVAESCDYTCVRDTLLNRTIKIGMLKIKNTKITCLLIDNLFI